MLFCSDITNEYLQQMIQLLSVDVKGNGTETGRMLSPAHYTCGDNTHLYYKAKNFIILIFLNFVQKKLVTSCKKEALIVLSVEPHEVTLMYINYCRKEFLLHI